MTGRVMRAVFRAPVRLYDHGLGGLFGRRFLCLTHVGRRSGRRYRTVLEVIGVVDGEYFVVAGLGSGSDWFRNLARQPAAEVIVGRHRFAPRHRVLDEAEAATVIAAYEHRNRWVAPILKRVLSKLLGWRYDGSAAARARMAGQLPIVGFRALPG
ncbi:nitroreductase family deazaflavin-dependent oxidoreductase [Amycolatopsis sp. OK19-0408]|uniref:Nitroreductase family deazaflavin-dependent oxidoreductase n=1 Tax=Amycolatopsis iheyensis TaxID=2945988 RepID=A0A9X2NEY4_9PSEU|nr:nitroreductase family deazaflavin-dependent oxidoreductase [Amycolatopsis iheyensis]MCR6485615.1 nitroreductase family deazaflavin-dependent oxidoreductase [Amycolatopsis iheyensis]